MTLSGKITPVTAMANSRQTHALLSDLARVTALFHARTLAMHMGADPDDARVDAAGVRLVIAATPSQTERGE